MYYSIDSVLIEVKKLIDKKVLRVDEVDEFVKLVEFDYKSDDLYHRISHIQNPDSLRFWSKIWKPSLDYIKPSSIPKSRWG